MFPPARTSAYALLFLYQVVLERELGSSTRFEHSGCPSSDRPVRDEVHALLIAIDVSKTGLRPDGALMHGADSV